MSKIKREDEEEISERAKKLIRLNKAKQFAQSINGQVAAGNSVAGINGSLRIPPLQLIKEPPKEPSDVGKFGWITVLNSKAPIPYFFSEGIKYVSSRIINDKVYSSFPKFPNEIYECVRIPSYPLSDQESQLLNEINFRHSDSFFGDILFRPILDAKITLEDFEQSTKFYTFCGKLLSKIELNEECCGFIRIDHQSYVPFIRRDSLLLLPVFYFEGDNCSLSDISLDLTKWEMTYLRLLCQVQQIKKHFFSAPTCQVMDLEEIKKLFSADTIFEESWPNVLREEWIRTHKKAQPLLLKPLYPDLCDQAVAPANLAADSASDTQHSDNNTNSTQPKLHRRIITRYNGAGTNAQNQSQAVISNITNSDITLNIHRPLNATPNTQPQVTSTCETAMPSKQTRPVMSISNVSNSRININMQTRSATGSKTKTSNTKSHEQASQKKKTSYCLRPKATKSKVAATSKPINIPTNSVNFGIVYPPKSTGKNSTTVTSNVTTANTFNSANTVSNPKTSNIPNNALQTNEEENNPTLPINIESNPNTPKTPNIPNNALQTIDENNSLTLPTDIVSTPNTTTNYALQPIDENNSPMNLRPVRKAIALQHTNILQIDEKSLPEFFAKHGHNFVEISKIALSSEQRHLFQQYYQSGHTNAQRIVNLLQTIPNPKPLQNISGNEKSSRDPRLQNRQPVAIPTNQNNNNQDKSSRVDPRLRNQNQQTIASEVNVQSIREPYTVGTVLIYGRPFVCINLKPHTDKKCESVLISTTDIGMAFFPQKFLADVDNIFKLVGLKLYKLCNSQRIAFERSGKTVGRDEMFVNGENYIKEFFNIRNYL